MVSSLDDILDITPNKVTEVVVYDTTPVTLEVTKPIDSDNDLKDFSDDIEKSRESIKEVIETGLESMQELMMIAKTSQHPKAFETVARMMDSITEASKALTDIKKKKMEVIKPKQQENNPDGQNNFKNNIFVGSTADVLKLLNKEQNE